MKQQVTADQAKPVTDSPDSSTESRCGKPIRVAIDVDESEDWYCVKDSGHQDGHYVENNDGSSGMAIKLTPIEEAHWGGFAAGAASVTKCGSPDDLREQGWSVAVHNDYRLHGESFTFWLLTKNERALKGEGRTDGEALNQIRERLAWEKSDQESRHFEAEIDD